MSLNPAVRPQRRPAGPAFAIALLVALAACSHDSTSPADVAVALAAAEGGGQFLLPGGAAAVPLTVVASDPTHGTPVENASISWRVTSGKATIAQIDARTDGNGFASASVTAGGDTGAIRVEASAPKMVGAAPTFALRAVSAPIVEAVSPTTVTGGQSITVTGRNFSTNPADNAVLFGGLRGVTRSASSTQLVVDAPRCVLSRSTTLRVTLGAVTSGTVPLLTVAAAETPLSLAVGKTLRIDQPTDLACVQFAAGSGSRFLLVPQNAVDTMRLPLRYELLGIAGASPVALPPATAATHTDRALEFETMLRRSEMAMRGGAPPQPSAAGAAVVIPAVGDKRAFNVLTQDNKSKRVTATVQAVSTHAIAYVDDTAPSGGFNTTDIQGFLALFDDPIYATDTSVYGSPSDIDGNGHIIVLFTPAVNALTDRSQSGFIAGYFYGCDLVDVSRCSATNKGEIFYGVVPDPQGQFSAARTKDIVLRTVPGVLAHEFQHMINFSRKGGRLDLLWLSEGLAHSAEEIVGRVLLARGDVQRANDFRHPNFVRAQLYLAHPASVAALSEESPGTLEQRGANWLLVEYLHGQYGGDALLGRLTASTALGAANIAGATGRPWRELLSEFGVALWADGAPDLAGISVDARYGFIDFDLHTMLGSVSGGYPLFPSVVAFQDYLRSDQLPAGTQDYVMLQSASPIANPFNLAFTGLQGGGFAGPGTAQLTILRVR